MPRRKGNRKMNTPRKVGRPPKTQPVEQQAPPVALTQPIASIAPDLGQEPAQARADDGPRGLPRQRVHRKPFGRQEAKLKLPPCPGYAQRWFNDTPGRIERALEAGYEHINDRDGKPIKRSVGTAERGGGLTAYAMKIPQDWFDEDFAAKQEANDETDRAILRGSLNEREGDHRYIPSSGIKITSSHNRRG